jgi:hypothetical protein
MGAPVVAARVVENVSMQRSGARPQQLAVTTQEEAPAKIETRRHEEHEGTKKFSTRGHGRRIEFAPKAYCEEHADEIQDR